MLSTVLHASDIIISKLWFLPSSTSESSQETNIIKVVVYDKVLEIDKVVSYKALFFRVENGLEAKLVDTGS